MPHYCISRGCQRHYDCRCILRSILRTTFKTYMKKLLQIIVLSVGLALLPACDTFMQAPLTTPLPVNASVVTNAEKTLRVSKDTFDFFLKLEYDNQTLVKSQFPQIHAFAEYLRKNAANWLITTNKLKNDYKHGNGDLQALLNALSNLTTNVNTANQYVSKINNP